MANAIQHVKYLGRGRGGINSVAYCPFCSSNRPFLVRVPKGIPGVGRGYGFAASSQARAMVARHIKAEHPEKLS